MLVETCGAVVPEAALAMQRLMEEDGLQRSQLRGRQSIAVDMSA